MDNEMGVENNYEQALEKYRKNNGQKNTNVQEMMNKMLKNDESHEISGENLHIPDDNSIDHYIKKYNRPEKQNMMIPESNSLLKNPSEDKDKMLNEHIIPPSPNASFFQPPDSPARSNGDLS